MYTEKIIPAINKQRILNSVALELTYQCNLKCFFCYNDVNKKGSPLSVQQYRTLLEDLSQMQTMFLMLTGGEPMIHPHFFEIGAMTKELGFVTRIRTNGHSLTRKMSERLKEEVDPYLVEVSLHGATPKTHDKQTMIPGSFKKLVKHIDCIKQAGLKIKAVSTPTAWNEEEIEDMFHLCDSLDVPLRFQGPVAPRDNGDRAPLAIQPRGDTWEKVQKLVRQREEQEIEMSQEQKRNDSRSKKEKQPTCGVGMSGVDIDPYGNVQACMHLQESAGNIHQHSIKKIWSSSPLFTRARARAMEAAEQFIDKPKKQLGAPLYCLAVEENLRKGDKVSVAPPSL